MRSSAADTRALILLTAEKLLRKHGPTKVTVSEVAAQAGMSHPNVYRHFKSKAALQEAVTSEWLDGELKILQKVVEGEGSPEDRLLRWMLRLASIKQERLREDPKLFGMYRALVRENRGVVLQYEAALLRHLRLLILEGVEEGFFTISNQQKVAETILDVTVAFRHPDRIERAAGKSLAADVRRAFQLINSGLKRGNL